MLQPNPAPTAELTRDANVFMKLLTSQDPLNPLYGCMIIAMISILIGAFRFLSKDISDACITNRQEPATTDDTAQE